MTDHNAFQGEWVSVPPGEAGFQIPISPELIGSKLRYQLNSQTSPKQIDLEHRKPRNRSNSTARGIYDFTEGLLKIAWSDDGERPQQFPAAAGDDTRLLVLKRVDSENS